MEKIRVIIASDKDRVGLRSTLKKWLEQNNNLEVILLSRLKISRIRGEIKPKNPTLVFITASLYTSEELKELCGFVKKLRKHLPKTNIIVNTPRLSEEKRGKLFEGGADDWIDDRLDYPFLGETLEAIVKKKKIPYLSQAIIKKTG